VIILLKAINKRQEGKKEVVIKIKKFRSNILLEKPHKFENRETLSMVMIDYDGEVFDFDEVFYAEDLKKNKWEVRFNANKIDGRIHDCIYRYFWE